CASPGEVEPTFLIFDVEDNAGAVQLIFDDRAHNLQLDYAQLQAASVVPDPTATPTPSRTATPTATPTATFTPASVALVASADDEQLPPAAMRHVGVDGRVAEDGLAFDLRRIDVWTEAPGGRQPRNDILLVFVGALTRTDNP